jgi:hypothetical protein
VFSNSEFTSESTNPLYVFWCPTLTEYRFIASFFLQSVAQTHKDVDISPTLTL